MAPQLSYRLEGQRAWLVCIGRQLGYMTAVILLTQHLLALSFYEYLITLQQEVNAVWSRKPSLTSMLLLSVRWTMVLNAAILWPGILQPTQEVRHNVSPSYGIHLIGLDDTLEVRLTASQNLFGAHLVLHIAARG